METQVDVDKVEPHKMEDKALPFIRNNTSGAAPMDIGNIPPGQTPAPGLGSSSQSTTSSSHGGSDSYPDLNDYEHAAQWKQDWNTGDVDTSGSSDGELYGLQKGKGRAKVEVSTASATTVESQVIRPSSVMQKVEKQKERERRETAKVGMTVKVGQSERSGQKVKGWNTSGKGWEQQRPARMNNLERDSQQYDVLVMEMSTQEETVRNDDWCVPVKHVAKLSRMRGSTSTKTNIKFFVDPEEEDRDNDTTSDCLGSKQFALEDDVSYKCSCCEADGMHWKRTRNLHITKPSVRFSSLTDADINFFEKGNTDLCELYQNTWAPLPSAVARATGCRFSSWRNSHASGVVDEPSFHRVRRVKSK